MKKTISYARSNNQLKPLTPILNDWIELVDHFCDIEEGDASYWYSERSNVGVMAAAAWRTKQWVALEEYVTSKRSSDYDLTTGKPKEKAGRCDLYIASPHGKAQYAIEAKMAWQPVGDRIKDPLHALKKKLDSAWSDAGSLYVDEASHRLAMTFCAPSISISVLNRMEQRGSSMEDIIQTWCASLKECTKRWRIDGLAYVFPASARRLEGPSGNRIFPGVAVLLRRRSRANK